LKHVRTIKPKRDRTPFPSKSPTKTLHTSLINLVRFGVSSLIGLTNLLDLNTCMNHSILLRWKVKTIVKLYNVFSRPKAGLKLGFTLA